MAAPGGMSNALVGLGSGSDLSACIAGFMQAFAVYWVEVINMVVILGSTAEI